MVKTLMSTMAMAIVAADDLTSLLQLSASVRQSQGQRILAALAEEDSDTICVKAAAGDVAPVAGSFTSGHDSSLLSVEAAAGSVAGEAGSFCVAKQDVLLIQRTFGLNTARDFEAALGSKRAAATTTTTTTTAMDWNIFNFSKNPNKVVVVERDACPKVEAGLVQTMDASVQQKSAKKKQLDADQLRVCECRNFMKSNVEKAFQIPAIKDIFKVEQNRVIMSKASAGSGNRPSPGDLMKGFAGLTPPKPLKTLDPELLQRSFDTALATKKQTTTTTTPCAASAIVQTCTGASYMDDWAGVAQLLNNPAVTTLARAANITGGWQHCDQSWVVQGACGVFVDAAAATKAC